MPPCSPCSRQGVCLGSERCSHAGVAVPLLSQAVVLLCVSLRMTVSCVLLVQLFLSEDGLGCDAVSCLPRPGR